MYNGIPNNNRSFMMTNPMDYITELNTAMRQDQHDRYVKEVDEVLNVIRDILLSTPAQIILGAAFGITIALTTPLLVQLLVIIPIILFSKEFDAALKLITETLFNIVTNIPLYILDLVNYFNDFFPSYTNNTSEDEKDISSPLSETALESNHEEKVPTPLAATAPPYESGTSSHSTPTETGAAFTYRGDNVTLFNDAARSATSSTLSETEEGLYRAVR